MHECDGHTYGRTDGQKMENSAWKIRKNFGQIFAKSKKQDKIGSIGSNIRPDLAVSFPITLNVLERRDARGPVFPVYLRSYVRTIWPRMTKLGTIIHVGRGVFLCFQPRNSAVVRQQQLSFLFFNVGSAGCRIGSRLKEYTRPTAGRMS